MAIVIELGKIIEEGCFVMIMSYHERKEAVLEDFEEFHVNMNYSIEQTLYAILGETAYSKNYTKADECCICVLFALILRKLNINTDYLNQTLSQLLSSNNRDLYLEELGDEFSDFESDLALLNGLM